MSQPPVPAIPVLSYAGPPVISRPAFNARRSWAWKGEHLFRVYLTPGQIYFIRIGGARSQEAAVAVQFGLVGGLIGWWMASRRKKKEEKQVLKNEDKPLEVLMTEHKRNHIIPITNLTDLAIEPTGFWSGGSAARLTFNQVGEKKRVTMFLEKVEDVDAALRELPALFPTLRVAVEFNPKKKRYVKAQR